ncbi:MAG: isopeptide-forming domain-containing fimbrial protein [Verrucomicrobia bacterium]|nr:isopeptide-forming domain-containing fimbrial protein [Verrucomicrobiota bacterium]
MNALTCASARLLLVAALLWPLTQMLGASAVPTATVSAPATVELGGSFSFTVNFDNTSPDTTGFGPYVDVAYDATGRDGAWTPGDPYPPAPSDPLEFDGLTVSTVVNYLGSPLPGSYVLPFTFDDTANGGLGVEHPFAKTLSGTPVYVKTTDFAPPGRFQNGDRFLVVRLPFGSFTPEQPVAQLSFSASVSPLADVNETLPISVRGGFQFGNDPLDNPTSDPTLIGAQADSDPAVIPTLLRLTKTYLGPENETATGPNFTRRYRLTVDIADGQTITGLRVVDLLPDTEQFVAVVIATRASGSGPIAPVTTPSTSVPGGTLEYDFSTVVGTASASDVVLEYDFFVPRLDANGDPVLNATTGDDRLLCNQAYTYGDWTPVDTRDPQTRVAGEATVSGSWPTQTVTPDGDCEHELEAQSIAIQKGVTIINDVTPTGLSPGDTLEYTLQFQVSDYFAFEAVRIDDVISDGRRWDTTFTPTMTVTEHGTTLAVAGMAAANYTVNQNFTGAVASPPVYLIDPAPDNGTTAIQFRISDELVTRSANANLVGGGIHSDTLGLEPDTNLQNNPPLPWGGTVGTIKFRTVVQDQYSDDYPSGNPSLNPRDGVSNTADIYGKLLNPADLTPLGTFETDDTGAGLTMNYTNLSKSIYAINGSTSLPDPLSVRPGDEVTFRLEMDLLTGDVEVFRLTDYVPLPIMRVDDPDADGTAGPAWSRDTTPAPAPPPGQWKYGPTDTLSVGVDLVPPFSHPTVGLNTSSGNNTIYWDFGTYDDINNSPRKVDLLFTLKVNDAPFADALLLMNQARSQERDTGNTIANTDSITPFTLHQPVVAIYKGVLGSDREGGRTLGGVAFAAPGASTALSSGPPAATLTAQAEAEAVGAANLTSAPLPDANERVRYGVVLFNSGRSDAYDVTVTDTIPAAYVRSYADATALAAGVNLIVQRGNGTVLTPVTDYLLAWNPATYTFTVELVDNYAVDLGTGGLNRGRDHGGTPTTDGSNVVIVSYDLTLAANLPANSTIINTATLTNYAGADGGDNHIPGGKTDDAEVRTLPPAFVKTVTGTEVVATGNGQFDAVIGELVTYTLTVTVPEGLTPTVVIDDTLAQGLAFVSLVSATPSSGVIVGTPTVTILDPGTARQVSFTLGDIQNNNTGNSGADTVTLVFTAVVLNQNTLPTPPGNQAGVTLDNTAQLTYATGPALVSTPAQLITIVEPALTVTKQVAPDDGGGPGAYAATLSGQDAGNTVYYRITITHAGGPAAFDLGMVDTFPAKLNSLTIYSATSTGASVNGIPATVAIADLQLTGSTLTFAPTSNIDLAPGGSITIEVSGVLDLSVIPGESIPNSALVTWTSLDGNFTAPRTSNNTTSTERTGAGGPGSDTAVLNNYAVQNATSTGVLNAAAPVLQKFLAASSEAHTLEPLIIADFTGTGFSTLSGNWATAISTQPQFVRIGSPATGTDGSGTLNFATPLDLRGYASLGVLIRRNTSAGNANLRVTLTDSDGTTARFDATITNLTIGAPGFSQVLLSSLLAPATGPSGGSIAGFDWGSIASLTVAGSTGGAVRWDIDRIVALRTLAAPGEIVRYRLVAQIPEGTLPDFALFDSIPPGIRFINDNTVRVAFVANGGGIVSAAAGSGLAAVPALTGAGLNLTGSGDDVSSFSLAVGGPNGLAIGEGTSFDANVSNSPTSDPDSYSDGTDVYFRLGTLTNTDSDADAEYVVIEFNALVTNDRNATATDGSAQQAGVGLSNTFQARLNSSTGNTQVGSTSTGNDFQAVIIVEPQINNLGKAITTVPVDAGDPIDYQIQFSNNTAHPAQYAPHVRAATTAGFSATFNPTGGVGGTGRFTGAPATVDGVTLAEGDRVLVKNQTAASQNGIYKVVDAVNGIWDRATDFDAATEMTLGYRAYVAAGTANGGRTFALDAAVATINSNPVTFSAVAANPAVRVATTSSLTGFSAGTFTGVSATQDGVTLSVGDRVLVRAQGTGSQNGVYVVTSVGGGNMNLTRATDFDTVAEFPVGIQVFVSEGSLIGGRTFAQSATVQNLNSGTNSTITWVPVDQVTAFDLVLTDVLPADVLFQSLTIVTPDIPAGQTFTASGTFTGGSVTVPAVNTSGTITVNLDRLDPEAKITGAVKDVTLTVNGVVSSSAAARQEIVNTAALTYTSLPGPRGTASNPTGTDPTTSSSVGASGGQYGERNGSGVTATDNTRVNYGTSVRNNYSVASTANTTLARPTVDKAFRNGTLTDDDTSLASTTGSDVAIGEQVTFDILVTLPEGTTPNVLVNDVLPTGLRLDSYSVTTLASGSGMLTANFNGTLGNNPPIITPALPATGATTVAFDFGTCAVAADGDANNNAFVLRITATVLNITANQDGVTRANLATLTFDDPAMPGRTVPDSNPANDPVVTVVEPDLSISKTVDVTSVDAGDDVTYTFVVSNAGSQAAYNVTLSDALPAVISSPVILTGPGDFTATGFYDTTVVAATTADLGATFSLGTFTGAPTMVDNVTVATGDLVLVKDQSNPSENGIYEVGSPTTTWTRWASFDDAAEMVAGYRVQSAGGVTQAGQVWVLLANVITVNTDPVNWAYYADVQAPTAGDFEISGSTLQVKPAFTLNIPPGASVTLKVKGTVANTMTPGLSIPNTASLAWTSLQGGSPDERTGADGPGGPLNDHAADSTITSAGKLASFAKSLFETDQTETSDPDVTIGEVVTYALKVTLPEGTTPDLTVTDNLPAGLDYESYSIVTTVAGSGGLLTKDYAGAVPTPSVSGGVGSGDDVTFTFGAMINPGNNDPDDNAFLILVSARVLDEAGNVGFVPGQTTLANTATFDISGDGVPPFTSPPVNTPVVEPRMTIVKNIVQPAADAGDVVDVVLTVNNTGLLTAYDVVIEDPLNPAKFDPASVNFGTAGVDYPPGFTPSVNLVTGLITYTGGDLLVGGPYVFQFKVALTVTVAPGEVVPNTATVTQATTLSGPVPGERNEPPVSASDTVTIYSHGLSGYVYHDANNNGLKETGESPIGSVTITLTGTDHLGNPVSVTTTTDAAGYYEFLGLRPGTYTLTETQPAGYLDGKETSGTPWTGTVDNTTDSQTISAITIPTGTPSTTGVNYNFGELVPASLAGVVYNDVNDSGTYNPGTDLGIYGATVTLTGTDDRGNPVNLTTTTAADGSYSFTNLRPGTYTLTETQPDGYTDSADTVGSLGGDGSVNDVVSNIPVVSGDAGTGYNFGEVGPGSIGDTIFLDLDNDGLPDPGEGISGVTVQLQGDLNGDGIPETITTVTDVNGNYLFDHLPAPTGGRSYTVTVLSGIASGLTQTVDPDGTNDGTSTTTLTFASPTDLLQDFGYRGNGSIGDTVFADYNNNGVFDTGEGLPNITVTLVGDADGDGISETFTTETDANGQYLFSGLRTTPGGVPYTVTVNTGDLDFPVWLTDNHVDPDGGGDSTSSVTLTDATPNRLDQDFGYRGTAQIGNFVWEDLDGDGLQEPGEAGFNGVTVELYRVGDTSPLMTQVTANDGGGNPGYYLFTGLGPDNYYVKFILPSGYVFTLANVGLDDTVDSDADPGTGQTAAFALGTGATDLTRDAGMYRPVSIGNYVWNDLNADGLQDEPASAGMNGVTVKLLDAGGAVIATTVTADDGGGNPGYYLFSNLPPGTYSVQFVTPTGFTYTTQNADGLGLTGPANSDANTLDGKTVPFTLVSGDAVTYVDAGLKNLPTAARLAYFRALVAGGGNVRLAWGTLVESGVLGFRVDRSTADGGWQRITPQIIPATGWDGRPQRYGLTDTPAGLDEGLRYRLVEVGTSGDERVVAIASVETGVSLAIARAGAGTVLIVRGEPQATVVLQSAPAVEGPWSAAQSVTLDAAGRAEIWLGTDAASAARFYRVLSE